MCAIELQFINLSAYKVLLYKSNIRKIICEYLLIIFLINLLFLPLFHTSSFFLYSIGHATKDSTALRSTLSSNITSRISLDKRTGDFIYFNPALKFKLEYPPSWKVKEIRKSVDFIGPQTADNKTTSINEGRPVHFTISVTNPGEDPTFPSANMTIQDFFDTDLTSLKDSLYNTLQVIQWSNSITFGGYPGNMLMVYDDTDPDFNRTQSLYLSTIANGKLYYGSYSTLPEVFLPYLPTIQKMIKSLVIFNINGNNNSNNNSMTTTTAYSSDSKVFPTSNISKNNAATTTSTTTNTTRIPIQSDNAIGANRTAESGNSSINKSATHGLIRIGKYITYNNPSLNLSIMYPVNWLMVPLENETFRFDIPPVTVYDNVTGGVYIHSESVDNSKNTSLSLLLSNITKGMIKYNRDHSENFQLHSVKPIFLKNGLPANMIEYSYKDPKLGKSSEISIVAVSPEREYRISYDDDPSKLDIYLPAVLRMMYSFHPLHR